MDCLQMEETQKNADVIYANATALKELDSHP